jgi:predicted HTH transcriptional regulator
LKNRYLKVIIDESVPVKSQEMSEKQNRILKLIAENNAISAKQLSVILNASDRTIERDIKKLSDFSSRLPGYRS